MKTFINYFTFCLEKIINILDTLKIGDYSILYYILGAIIIGFLIKLVKGSSNEFEHSMNFSTGSIVVHKANQYRMKHEKRKEQIVNDKEKEKS